MKTTIEISDVLFERAKRHAQRTGRPMRVLMEEGLRLVLGQEHKRAAYRLEDLSLGDPNAPDPLESFSWQDLRNEIYGGR
jgi:hypothetical protein